MTLGSNGQTSGLVKGGCDVLRCKCTIVSSTIDCYEVHLANLLSSLMLPLVLLLT